MIKASRQKIVDWVEDVITNEDKLLSVQIANSFISKYRMGVNKSWLEGLTGVHRKVAEREPEILVLFDNVIEAMINAKIILEGETASSNNMRCRLLEWYRSLSFDEKKALPIYRNKINFKRAMSRFSFNHERSSNAVKSVLLQINKDHRNFIRKNMTEGEKNEKRFQLSVIEKSKIEDKYEDMIVRWVKRVLKKNWLLWNIPIVTKRVEGKLKYLVSKNWVIKTLNISDAAYKKFGDIIHSVIPRMIELEIIILGECAHVINVRRKIYNWFNAMSDNEKKNLPIRNNRISRMYLIKQVGTYMTSGVINATLDDIHEQLVIIGVIEQSDNFVCFSDRIAFANKDYHTNIKKRTQEWIRLSEITLDNTNAILTPTDNEPLIQIKQLYAINYFESRSTSARNNIRDSFEKFSEHIKLKHGEGKFLLSELLGDFTFIDFRSYLQKNIIDERFSPSYANTVLSSLRSALDNAKYIDGLVLPDILEVDGFQVERVTNRYKPFSDYERNKISQAIQEDLANRRMLLVPYQKCKSGNNPLDEKNNRIRGMLSDENAKWLFENKLNKKIITATKDITKDSGTLEAAYVRMIIRLGGVHETYARWNIASKIDIEFLIPFLLRLAQITGLNSDSMCDLEIDDYVESHPATGRPCLRYWKERSDGEKEYHLDIFKAKLGWLTTKQSFEVKCIFEDIKVLTNRIRNEASDDVKNYLFIYKLPGGKVKNFTIYSIFKSVKNFSEKHKLVDAEDNSTQFNIARFRPTFVSELVELGVSIREIQLLLGHSSIAITMSYLDKLDFNKKARDLLSDKLKQIHSNVFTSGKAKNSNEDGKVVSKEDIIYSTPLAGCSNIFDPPEFIKNLHTYVPGISCANYNKCLSCDNVVIINRHLPELFAMQRDYLDLVQRNRLGDTPYGKVIEENLLLLNEMLNPGLSDFSVEELEKGKRLARYIETSILVDGVVA